MKQKTSSTFLNYQENCSLVPIGVICKGEDDSCGVLYGIVRDCAYKMIDTANKERLRHIEKGIWDKCDEH